MTDPIEALGLRLDDDDYRPAQPLRWAQPYPGHAVLALTTVGALLVGFLLALGITAGRDAAAVKEIRRGELVALISARQEHVDAQAGQLEQLRTELAAAEAEITGPSHLADAVARAEQEAGLTRVDGPGMRVTFDDATSTCRGLTPEDCRIQDADLQLAVNALFGLGAEAVAVNGERVISTTAIRGAGRAILVNYRVLTPPYVIEAVGDGDLLEAEFALTSIALDFEAWKDRYGLGFVMEPVDVLELPSYGGSVRFRQAAIGGQTP
jgi:uncharacterized protein YlxW (UPF0749 family)